jgi:hypothetical protein
MTRAFCWWMRIAAVILALTGATHLVAQLAGEQPPKNDSERTLLDLMRNYRQDMLGASLSMSEILSGFGLFFSWVLFALAALVWMAARGRDPGLARGTALVGAAFAAVAAGISATHWPIPPTVLLGAAAVCFIGAFVAGRARPSGAT